MSPPGIEESIPRSTLPPPSTQQFLEPSAGQLVTESIGKDGFEAPLSSLHTSDETTSMDFSLRTGLCRIVLVDLGSEYIKQSASPRISRSVSTSNSTECIFLSGKFEVSAKTSVVPKTRIQSFDSEIHCDNFEIYSAFGEKATKPVQILDPTKVSGYLLISVDMEGSTSTDCRVATVLPVEISCSMRNVALLNSILSTFSHALSEGDELEQQDTFLTSEQTAKIEDLALKLQNEDSDGEDVSSSDDSKSILSTIPATEEPSPPTESRTYSIKFTVPSARFTLINDLQGLDDALLRMEVQNVVFGAQARSNQSLGIPGPRYTGFDVNLHCSVLSDFFDSTGNQWSSLLVRPWELNFRGSRGLSSKYEPSRPSTSMEIEAFPCHLVFSEQFLTKMASAKQMWSVYATALETGLASAPKESGKDTLRRSIASSAARTFITGLPFAVDNRSGFDLTYRVEGDNLDRECPSGFVDFFAFEYLKVGSGSGGKRLYGQDIVTRRTVSIKFDSNKTECIDLDSWLGQQPKLCRLDGNRIIVLSVFSEGKVRKIHVSSGVTVRNNSLVSFGLSVPSGNSVIQIGRCDPLHRSPSVKGGGSPPFENDKARRSRRYGIPSPLLSDMYSELENKGSSKLCLIITPGLPTEHEFSGRLDFQITRSSIVSKKNVEIVCRPQVDGISNDQGPFIFCASIHTVWIDGQPVFEIDVEPRGVVRNEMPISILVHSPMPYLFLDDSDGEPVSKEDNSYLLLVGKKIEVFTSGPSIAVSLRCADSPIGGTSTDWMEGQWLDLPLMTEFRLTEPIQGCFPFVHRGNDPLARPLSGGMNFFVAQGEEGLSQLGGLTRQTSKDPKGEIELQYGKSDRSEAAVFFITSLHTLVDHSGDLLFEQYVPQQKSLRVSQSFSSGPSHLEKRNSNSIPLGTYWSSKYHHRITPLSSTSSSLSLLHLNMQGDDGIERSVPFRIEDISIGEGGVESTQLFWNNGSPSGFCAYRKLINAYASEIHFIPEYILYNGSTEHDLTVRRPDGSTIVVKKETFAPLHATSSSREIISLFYEDVQCYTSPLRVDDLGLRIVLVKTQNNRPRGTVAIQTVTGTLDSRLVVKVGPLRLGQTAGPKERKESVFDLLDKDYLRFRIQWSELKITLNEARSDEPEPSALGTKQVSELGFPTKVAGPLCAIIFHRFTIDWQRVFKSSQDSRSSTVSTRKIDSSNERSQLSVIIHNIQLHDLTPNAQYPVVFDSTSDSNFFDLCIRTRGPIDAWLIRVDLVDLNLACSKHGPETIVASTSEAFVWKVIDLSERIISAAADFAGVSVELKWDPDTEEYKVAIRDANNSSSDPKGKYTPPSGNTLYDIQKLRVSPFTILTSFARAPDKSRYKVIRGSRGANIMNYFTRRLKFTIKNADLSFSRYEANGVKGPIDRVLEILATVYMSRMKLKFVTIMTAASFQDWKYLAARDRGDDEFVEGDILRVTGNLAGNTANYVLQKAGKGLGSGFSTLTNKVGDGIESATELIGAKPIGAGLNSVVSGVGEGVSSTVSGGKTSNFIENIHLSRFFTCFTHPN